MQREKEKPVINPAALSALAKGDFENAAVASTPGGIEAQEKSGQTALVNSTHMPKELRPSKEAFEKIGFKFGKDVDDIFVEATLPAGWTRSATSHAMHSDIMDEQGRKRIGVFYKAAFYDRRADAYLIPRYRIETHRGDTPEDNVSPGMVAEAVMEAGVEIYRTSEVSSEDWSARNRLSKIALAWLTEAAPDFADPTAYW